MIEAITNNFVDPILKIFAEQKQQEIDKDIKILKLTSDIVKEEANAILKLMGKGTQINTEA